MTGRTPFTDEERAEYVRDLKIGHCCTNIVGNPVMLPVLRVWIVRAWFSDEADIHIRSQKTEEQIVYRGSKAQCDKMYQLIEQLLKAIAAGEYAQFAVVSSWIGYGADTGYEAATKCNWTPSTAELKQAVARRDVIDETRLEAARSYLARIKAAAATPQ